MSSRGMQVLQLGALAVGVAAMATLLSLLAIVLGAGSGLGAVIILRTAAALLTLTVALLAAVASWRTIDARGFIAAALVSYLLMPLALGGRALLTQLLLHHWLVCLVLDLVLWVGVAVLVVHVQTRRHPRQEPADVSLRGLQ